MHLRPAPEGGRALGAPWLRVRAGSAVCLSGARWRRNRRLPCASADCLNCDLRSSRIPEGAGLGHRGLEDAGRELQPSSGEEF